MLLAYESGIFPWYPEWSPIVWWAPDERCILRLDRLKLSKSLRATLRKQRFEVRIDTDFDGVIAGCADREETWLSEEVGGAFKELHRFGAAHSFETWCDGELVGGLFGVAIGRQFTGDSMFSYHSDASKVAFAHLVEFLRHWGFGALDCQIVNDHLLSLGAEPQSRAEFMTELAENVRRAPSMLGPWTNLRPPTWPFIP
jgi:leucyl/phenylalanyl-tRNA--protein transferase